MYDPLSASRLKVWQWAVFAAVVAAALVLRAHAVSRIFLWLDETDVFNEWVYGAHHKSLVDFAFTTRNLTTLTWGWPAIVWISARSLGGTVGAARFPTLLVNTAAVPLLFALVYRLLAGFRSRFWPALFAAVFLAISVIQMDYAQRTYPYGALAFAAVAVLLGHFEILRATCDGWKRHRAGAALAQSGKPTLPAAPGSVVPRVSAEPTPQLFRAIALYTAAIVFSFCAHPSAALIPAISMTVISYSALRSRIWEQRKVLLWTAAAGLLIVAAALSNVKNPKYGFRPYLADYYTPLSLSSIPTLLLHAYGLATYQLNLFYNSALYYPDRLNLAVLPLVLMCVFGWQLAARGKFGAEFRHLALFGAVALLLPVALSLVKVFPFGGVRQLLFLGPFLMAFVALGFYALRASAFAKILGIAAAGAYLIFWAVNLPRFYNERLPQYTPDEIVSAWRENGQLPVYGRMSERELWYELRDHPEVHVEGLSYSAKPPYLLVTTHNWIGDDRWLGGFPESLRQAGYRVTVLKQASGFHIDNRLLSGSLYFPPNGFWIYKITAE
jgi:hypothetical protein